MISYLDINLVLCPTLSGIFLTEKTTWKSPIRSKLVFTSNIFCLPLSWLIQSQNSLPVNTLILHCLVLWVIYNCAKWVLNATLIEFSTHFILIVVFYTHFVKGVNDYTTCKGVRNQAYSSQGIHGCESKSRTLNGLHSYILSKGTTHVVR